MDVLLRGGLSRIFEPSLSKIVTRRKHYWRVAPPLSSILRPRRKNLTIPSVSVGIRGSTIRGESESASYEGSGKTTVSILNEDVTYLMVDAFSLNGFRVNNGMKVYGPMVIFPNSVISWRVKDFLEVNERALSLFSILEPKPEVVIVGYGDRQVVQKASDPVVRRISIHDEEENEKRRRFLVSESERQRGIVNHAAKLVLLMKKNRINLECLPTEDAVSYYNYLCSEDRLVAGAFIPPNRMPVLSVSAQMNADFELNKDHFKINTHNKNPFSF